MHLVHLSIHLTLQFCLFLIHTYIKKTLQRTFHYVQTNEALEL